SKPSKPWLITPECQTRLRTNRVTAPDKLLKKILGVFLPPWCNCPSHGKTNKRRSLVVHGCPGSGIYRPGHGVQRIRCYGEGTLRISLHIPFQTARLGSGRNRCACRGDENRLPTLQAPGRGFLTVGRDHADADFRVLSRPRPQ